MNEQRVADALQDCLERIEAGQTPAQALGRHPELRAELAPRLQVALTVRAWHPGTAPAFGPHLRARLAQVDAERASVPRLLTFARWQAPLLRVAAVLLAVGLALGTAGYAAASILPPDHWLQPLVSRIERVRQGLVDTAYDLLPGVERDTATVAVPPARAGDEASTAPLEIGPVEAVASVPNPDSGSADRASERAVGSRGAAPAQRDPAPAIALAPIASTTPIDRLLAPSPTALPSASSGPEALPSRIPTEPASLPPTEAPPPTATEEPAPNAPEPPLEPEDPPATALPAPTDPPPGPPPPPTSTPVPPDAPGAISGEVVWKDNHDDPVRDIEVLAFAGCPAPGELAPWRTRADRDGRFRLEGLAPGSYRIAVKLEARGRIPVLYWHRAEWSCIDADVVELAPGQTQGGIQIQLRDRSRGGPGGGDDWPGPGGGERPGPGGPGAGQAPREPGGPPPEPTAEPTLAPMPEPSA